MKARTRITLVLLMIAALLATAPVSAGAQEASEGQILFETETVRVTQDGDWISYDRTTPIGQDLGLKFVATTSKGAETPGVLSRKLVKGKKEGADCKVTFGSESRRAKPVVQIVREIRFNSNTCESEFEILELDPAEVTEESLANVMAVEGDSYYADAPDRHDGSISARSTTQSYVASLKVNYEDPPMIDVTTTMVTVRGKKRSTDNCLHDRSASAHYDEFGPTGWVRTSQDWTYEFKCNYVSADAQATFENSPFCKLIFGPLMPTTHVDHAETYAKVTKWGGWAWSSTQYKSGGCNWMLSPEHIFVAP